MAGVEAGLKARALRRVGLAVAAWEAAPRAGSLGLMEPGFGRKRFDLEDR